MRHIAFNLVMKLSIIALLTLAFASGAFGQTPQPQTDQSLAAILSDPSNLSTISSMASVAANVTTDWRLKLGQREYNFSPAQTASMLGGGTLLFLAIDHYAKPGSRWRKITTSTKIGLTAYLTGRALANTYNHTSTTPALAAPVAPKLVLGFQFGR